MKSNIFQSLGLEITFVITIEGIFRVHSNIWAKSNSRGVLMAFNMIEGEATRGIETMEWNGYLSGSSRIITLISPISFLFLTLLSFLLILFILNLNLVLQYLFSVLFDCWRNSRSIHRWKDSRSHWSERCKIHYPLNTFRPTAKFSTKKNLSTLWFFSILINLLWQTMWLAQIFCIMGWLAIVFTKVSHLFLLSFSLTPSRSNAQQ